LSLVFENTGGLLFQQFLVDAWAFAESMDLDFLQFSQNK
jgi:hypothetical protein